jgi:hypothetical protein
MARLELWRRTRISSRRVIIGVANQRVVVRLVDLPWTQFAAVRPGHHETPYRTSQFAEIQNPSGLPA